MKIIDFARKGNAVRFYLGEDDLADVHEALYKDGIMHDLVREYVFWFDRDEEGG